MSAKTNAEVVIDGKVYTLCGYEEPEYLQKVAAYINSKIGEIDALDGFVQHRLLQQRSKMKLQNYLRNSILCHLMIV